MKRLWLRRLTSSEISLLWFLGPEAASEGCCPQGLSEVEIPGTRKKRGFILPFLRQFSTDSKLCGGVCVPAPTPSLQSADVNLKGRQFGPPMSALVPFSLTFGKASMRLGRERARLVPAALGQISLESSSSSTVVLRVCAACMHVHAHRPPPRPPHVFVGLKSVEHSASAEEEWNVAAFLRSQCSGGHRRSQTLWSALLSVLVDQGKVSGVK